MWLDCCSCTCWKCVCIINCFTLLLIGSISFAHKFRHLAAAGVTKAGLHPAKPFKARSEDDQDKSLTKVEHSSMQHSTTAPNTVASSNTSQREHRSLQHSRAVVQESSAISKSSVAVGGNRSASNRRTQRFTVAPSPSWTFGEWVMHDPAHTTPYTMQQCLTAHPTILNSIGEMGRFQPDYRPRRMALWQPHWPKGSGSDKELANPLADSVLGRGPWSWPRATQVHRLLRSRRLVFFGDSICGQQTLSLACLLLCTVGGATVPHEGEKKMLSFPSMGSTIQSLMGGQLLGFARKARRDPNVPNYYIDKMGQKVPIRNQGWNKIVDISDFTTGYLKYLAKELLAPNVTLVINTGRWFEFVRDDVLFMNNTRRLPLLQERGHYLKAMVKNLAQWLTPKLQKGSLVIWMGASPNPEDKKYCGREMHPLSKAVWDGLQELNSRHNFFIDLACAGGSPGPQRRQKNDIHWMLPGMPDLMNLFLLRLLFELGITR